MTTKIIKVSPLPVGTSKEDVQIAFGAYVLDRIAVVKETAFLSFQDINDVDTLEFSFENMKVETLGNAEISLILEEFEWPGEQSVQNVKQEQKEQPTPPKKQQEPMFILENKPAFIVVKECDPDHLQHCNEQFIRKQIFGKNQIGRILRWEKEVFVEFLDQNQIQILQKHFEGFYVQQLGPLAKIEKVDQNFNALALQNSIKQLELEELKKRQEQQIKKQEELKRRQEEQIQKKREELQRRQEEQIKKKQEEQERRKQEEIIRKKDQMQEIRRAHERQEQLKKMKELEEKKLSQIKKVEENIKQNMGDQTQENQNKGKEQWTVRPDYIEEVKQKAKSPYLKIFWLAVVIGWGIYVMSA